jgi:hypothetical protein
MLVVAHAGAASAGAQQRPPEDIPQTRIGSRVRVLAPSLRDDRYVGRITDLPPDSMTLDTTGVRRRLGFDTGPVLVDEYRYVTIPLAAVERIEVSAGRTTTRSTIKGVLIGALAGGVVTGGGNLPEVNPGFSDFAKGFTTGAVIGAVVGGVVGYLLGGERWLPAGRPAGALPPR